MIKFFRKIRQNLLSEGKTEKYFKYAIGEIVLVVIGILIALQINNWNENSKNKRLETNYLIRISKDLESDILEFDKAIRLAQERNDRVIFLQDVIENPELLRDSTDYFVQSIIVAGYTYLPTISNHSFEELKSSGRLSLIQDETLRILIAKYYDFIFIHTQWKYLRENIQIRYNELTRGILNREQMNWVLTNYYNPDSLSQISEIELDVDGIYERFKTKKSFHSFLPEVFADKYNGIKYIETAKIEAENLKMELNKKTKDNIR